MAPFYSIGDFRLATYGTLLALAFLIASIVFYLLAERAQLPRFDALNILALIFAFSLVGAKVFYLLSIIPQWSEISQHYNSSWEAVVAVIGNSGFVFYGGFFAGILTIVLYNKHYNFSILASLDIASVAVAIGHGIGRIGCFATGCCYGVASKYGIVFRKSPVAPNGIPLLPTQLIEASFCFLLSIVLYVILRKRKRDGVVFLTYITSYAIFRFIIEFWRGDAHRGFIGPLSLAQWFSLAILLIVFFLFVINRQRLAEKYK